MKPPVHAVRNLGSDDQATPTKREITQQEVADASRLDIGSAESREDNGTPRLEQRTIVDLRHDGFKSVGPTRTI